AFNGWDPDEYTLDRADRDFYLFFTILPTSVFIGAPNYKFVGKNDEGGDVWFADPHARRFDYDDFGEYSLVFGNSESHLERYHAFHANALDNDRDLYLYLPPGYETAQGKRYPVLYMHDGQNLFDPAAPFGSWYVDEVIDDLLAEGAMKEIIVCGLANTPDRMDEYTHVEDFVLGLTGGDAPLYADLLVNQVKPFIDERYRTLPDRSNTAILGSSLGGLVSFWIGYNFDDVFSLVGSMSGTMGWGSINLHNETIIEIIAGGEKKALHYSLDSGGDSGAGPCVDADDDGIEDDNPNASDNYCENLQLRNVLEGKGYGAQELRYHWSPGAPHNESAWHERLPLPLTFFFAP
ncbi:MAG: alpha/beta hydrolase, partial [Deltaproteobacteria bacterium]